jgi:hypothetical protein
MDGVAGRGAPAGVLGFKWLIAGLFEFPLPIAHRLMALTLLLKVRCQSVKVSQRIEPAGLRRQF